MQPPIIFNVCGTIATKFCTGIENQSVSSNVQKMHKINDVIIVRKLPEKTVKRKKESILKSLLLLHLLFNPTETL